MTTRIPAMLALALAGLGTAPAAAACLEGPYRTGAVPKHSMTPMHSAKPRNPLEEPLPRCAAARERGEVRERFAEGQSSVLDD